MTTEQQSLVVKYMPLAKKLAGQKKRVLPRHVDYEELESAAYMGLVEAASRFDASQGVAFSTFAYRRIFGAICDWLRQQGWGRRNEYLSVQSLECPTGQDGEVLGDLVEDKSTERNDDEFVEHASMLLKDNSAKDILQHYFVDEFSMREVGDKFGVSESRISQIIKKYRTNVRSSWDKRSFQVELAA